MGKPYNTQTPTKIKQLAEQLEKAKDNPQMTMDIEMKLKGFNKTIEK